jgi:hypothetical protein
VICEGCADLRRPPDRVSIPRMTKKIILAASILLAASTPAFAGGQEGAIGAGAEFGLNGLTGGVSMNYDAGKFHVGGFLGFFDGDGEDNTDYTIGARFFWHVHSTAMSDFGIGGTFGLFSVDDRGAPPPDDERDQLMFLEPSFQIRLFLASNVALSFNAGIVIGLVDADGLAISAPGVNNGAGGVFGVVNAAAGVHYYFF